MRATLFFLLGAFTQQVLAGCGVVQDWTGHLSAICLDEITGQEFEYLDLHDEFRSGDQVLAVGDPGDLMYEAYVAAVPDYYSNTSLAFTESSVSHAWQVCKDKVSGICGNTAVIAWTGTISSFAQLIYTIIEKATAKKGSTTRLDESPRSICTKQDDAMECVSWNAYFTGVPDQATLLTIAQQCASQCQARGLSCETRAVLPGVQEYFCVSSRATHCGAAPYIPTCPAS